MRYYEGMTRYYEVRTGDKIRFQSIRLEEAQEHAKKIHSAEGVIPEIYECD